MIRGGLIRPFTGYLTTSSISFLPPLDWWRFGELWSRGPVDFSQLFFEVALTWSQPGEAMWRFYEVIGEVASRMIYSSIPIAFAACAWLWVRAFLVDHETTINDDPDNLGQARFFAAAGVSLAITVSAFPRTDFVHVITIYPAVVLILFALSHPALLGYGWRPQSSPTRATQRSVQGRRLRIETAFVALILGSTTLLAARYDSTLTHRLSLERPDLWVKPQDAWLERLVAYVQKEIPEGEPIFVYGHEAHWYYLSNRYAPRAFPRSTPE